ISSHDLCGAIAGAPLLSLHLPHDLPSPEQLDTRTKPHDTHHILDADSSQHSAILAATREASLVLDGPPGTGKSQTIANIIAEFLAAGKTVLFVSEKTAALEVVKRRLDDRGLGDFCLELHSHKANKRAVLSELERCLGLPAEPAVDVSRELRKLYETRRQLHAYVRALPRRREPLGMSAFEVHGILAGAGRLAGLSRCPVPGVLERDGAYLQRVTDLLSRLPECRTVLEEGERHPWHGSRVAGYS